MPPKTPLSGEHGSQGTARQDVDVQVRHLLSRIRPDIGKQAIAGFDRYVPVANQKNATTAIAAATNSLRPRWPGPSRLRT